VNVLDLFSGIGGFSLGLERAGMRTVAFCEIDPYCRAVLRKHWPDVPIHEDVRSLTSIRLVNTLHRASWPIDVICGGFPCQDISEAGRGSGIEGERSGLWRSFYRLIGELRPRYAIVENVSALAWRGLGTILGDLAEIGYDAEWSSVSACSVGAPHPRERVFIVAYPEGGRREQRRRIKFTESSNKEGDVHHWKSKPEPPRVADGIPLRTHRNRALGNAVIPQIVEAIGSGILRAEV
jgi:DNA (cytosine-5)-methyltransferase 1